MTQTLSAATLTRSFEGSGIAVTEDCPDCPNLLCVQNVQCITCRKLTCVDGLAEHYCAPAILSGLQDAPEFRGCDEDFELDGE